MSARARRWMLATALLGVPSAPAGAAEINAKLADHGVVIVAVTGKLEAADVQRFDDAIAQYGKGVVVFASPGGSLEAGLRIGTTIRMRNFVTAVPTLCASACALAWLGGAKRFMAVGAHVGFHAAYILNDGQPMESGKGNALVGAYLDRLGLSYNAVAYITEGSPQQITWLTPESARQVGIDVGVLPPPQSASNDAPSQAPETPAVPATASATAPAAVPAAPAAMAGGQPLGPSFDCGKADTPVTRFICASPALAKADLEYVQPYYVLRHLVGAAGWRGLMVEAIAAQQATAAACGIDPASGTLPDDHAAFANCLATAYANQRALWLARLSGAGWQEATRPIEQHVALQARLQALGFLPATATIDGVYGTGTRTAIVNWQLSAHLAPTGLLGDEDARQLLAVSAPAIAQAVPQSSYQQFRFVCPEALPDQPARRAALAEFVRWMAKAHPELNTTAKMLRFRFRLLVAHHCAETLTNLAQHDVAPNHATVARLGQRFKHDLAVGGISKVITSVQDCYDAAKSDPGLLRPCLLYDSAAMRLDVGMHQVTAMRGLPLAQAPYFTATAFKLRMQYYGGIAFAGSTENERRYLDDASVEITKLAVKPDP